MAAALAPLREAAAELQASLEVLLQGGVSQAGYPEIAAALESLMPAVYLRYDAYVAAVLATGTERATCSRACSHCCAHYVTSVEPYEILFLHGRARLDPAYASRLVAFHRRATLFRGLLDPSKGDESEDHALHRYYLRGMPCPFLASGGVCGVYAQRPMSCRMFHSLSHPSLCRGAAVTSPGNRNFIIELPEDVETSLARAGALFAPLSMPESLFEGMLAANELFGRFDGGVSVAAEPSPAAETPSAGVPVTGRPLPPVAPELQSLARFAG